MSENCSDRGSDAYDTDNAEEDDTFSEEEDAQYEPDEATTSWNYIPTPDDANVTIVSGTVEDMLYRTMREEINVISHRILNRMDTDKDLLNDIAKMLINPLL